MSQIVQTSTTEYTKHPTLSENKSEPSDYIL